jgi:anti-sigma-K factor RskA
MTTKDALEREEIELLLPWHAAGTLGRRDAQRVEQALAQDGDLARQYALVREELAETIHLNETLGAPSARAMERLLAGIEAESGAVRQGRSFSFSTWISERLSSLAPRTLAWSAVGAALAITLQAGLLASMYVGTTRSGPELASVSSPSSSFVRVRFVPTATAADITQFLKTNKLTLVDGPAAGEFYRVRVADAPLPKEEVGKIAAKLREQSGIVGFVATE